MSKHTPGPWNTLSYVCNGENGQQIENEEGLCICDIPKMFGRQKAILGDEAKANAKLIAAAPELLEAAHNALILLRGSGFTDSTKAILQLKAAIAKAGA